MKSQKRTPRIPSTQTGALWLLALLALTLALLVPAAASAKQARLFAGTFGAATNPAPFPANPYPLENAESLAVDESSHDVYVNDAQNHRVEKFDSAGHFLLMIGKEVNKTKVEEAGSTEAEQNLCSAESGNTCQAANEGATPGTFETPTFLAVDNSSGPSKGDLYVASMGPGRTGQQINEQQTVTVNATGGSFTLSFEGQTTPPIAFDAPAESVEEALRTLPALAGIPGAPSVHVSGSPGAYTVKFEGELAGRNVPQLLADSSALSGGTATATVATAVQGSSTTRVEKFDPSGHVVSGWGEGGQLDGSSITSPPAPVAGPFGAGIFGGFAGIAVDPSGNLWVAASRQMFEFRQDSSFATGWQPAGASGGIAVDSEDNLYLNGGFGVEKYASSGNPIGVVAPSKAEINEGKAITINGLTLDPASNDLYLDGQKAGEGIVQRYDSSCHPVITNETPQPGCAAAEAFGAGLLSANPRGIAIDASNQEIYVAEETKIAVFAFLDLPEVATTLPLNPTPTAATLTGTVNPGGVELNEGLKGCRFEWGLTAAPYEHVAPCDKTKAQIGKGNVPVEVKANITGLEAGKTYHYRLVVSNPNDSNESIDEPERGADLAFGPPAIESASALDVSATSATLEAQVDPDNADTHAHIEYVTQQQFELNGFSEATTTPQADLPAAGPGQSATFGLSGLAPHTIYRYRLLIESALGAAEGEVLTFTTQSTGALLLPDHRGWELVSPPDKHGGKIEPISEHGVIEAAAGGGAISYFANAPIEADPPGNSGEVQALSLRGSGGWSSCNIASPHQGATGKAISPPEYRFFAEDLSVAVAQPFGLFNPELSPEATEQTPYLRTLGSCSPSARSYSPMVTAANVSPPGTQFGEEALCDPTTEGGKEAVCGPRFLDATNDLSHLVLSSPAPLTLGAGREQLYEWSGGTLQQVSLLPPNGAGEELPAPADPTSRVQLGWKFGELEGSARQAISADGARVFWGVEGNLYMRDSTLSKTIQLDAGETACVEAGECESGGGRFQIASADGSRAFFTDDRLLTEDSGASEQPQRSDLYECRIGESAGRPTCDLTDLTPETGGEQAGIQANVLGASVDGEDLYFVATGTLATGANARGEGAIAGQPNLYVRKGHQTIFVATLSTADSADWTSPTASQPTRVSPSGRYLAFMSARPLTGYDNRDALSGRPDAEVFLYDAGSGRILCASCDPSGARPVGIEYRRLTAPGVEHPLATASGQWKPTTGWVAALLPQATSGGELVGSTYQGRYLSDSGRLFFNVLGPLVPADSNGVGDVYEFEFPQGPGQAASDTCTAAAPTYSPASGGCVDLISSGTSKESSGFMDASESGDDVFFLTGARLTPKDVDAAGDIYDARVGGGEAPVVNPPACEGDACQAPAVPPNDPTPGSLTSSGAGNLLECPKGKVEKSGKCVKKQSKKHKHHKAKKSHSKRSANHNRRAGK